MESPLSLFRMQWDPEPTSNPSQEGNWHDADVCLLPSSEGLGVGRFMERKQSPGSSMDWEVRRSSPGWRGRFFSDRREVAFFAAAHESFGHGFQLFPACANVFRLLFGDMVVRRGGRNDRQQVGEFLNDLVGCGHEMNRMRPDRLGVFDEEPAGPFTNPVNNPGVVGAADQRFDAVEWIGGAAAAAIIRLGPFV